MMMFYRSLWLLLFSLSAASAADFGWQPPAQKQPAHVQISNALPEQGKVRLLLDITLDDGWKTYWRTPGDGGFRPEISWSVPAETQWHWPAPVRFDSAGFSSVGYHHQVTFPLEVTTPASTRLRGDLTLSVCSNLCTVTTVPIDIDLTTASAHFADDWAAAMQRVPQDTGPFTISSVATEGDMLTIHATSAEGWSQGDLFVDNPPGVRLSEPRIDISGQTLTARLQVQDEQGIALSASQLPHLSAVLSNGGSSQQMTITVADAGVFWRAAGFALLGGFILNLMPCVLPVMGMKFASLMTLADSSRRQIRIRFLATAAGMIFSFLVLAAVVTALRLSGHWVGWGFQFHSPWFIALMALVTWLFCFSLAGMVEIRLPSGLTTRLATAGGRGIGGSFLEGAFATLLATPCSAPFLGTAVTYALATSFTGLWAIFLALGVGMSLPWLLISLMPGMARFLPKPGPWMGKLRALLVIIMLASSMWLMSLLVTTWGARTVLIAAGLMLAFFLYRCSVTLPRQRENLRTLVFAVLFAAGVYAFIAPPPQGHDSPLNWQPLSQSALNDALRADKRVLVDITADWCLNCRVNEMLVLHRPDVVAALSAPDVVLLQGNWSKPSAEIAQFLRQYGASGIPFNAIFGPGAPDGIIQSSLLNKTDFLNGLQHAGATDSPDIRKVTQ